MKRFGFLLIALSVAACAGDSSDSNSENDQNDDPDADVTLPDGGSADGTPGDVDATPEPTADAGPPPVCTDGQTRCVDENTLETCENGDYVASDCPGGQECRAQGAGFACLDPVQPGDFVVTGTVKYQDREPLTSNDGGAPLGPHTEKPARGVTVAVILDSSPNTPLVTGVTADDGSYTLVYQATAGAQVHVLASTVSTVPTRPWRVVKQNNNTSVHGFGGASFAASETVTSNLLVTEALGAQAFNIFDQMVLGGDAVRLRMGVSTLQPIRAKWTKGSQDGTYYNGTSFNLLGASDDDDGYDDAVILHEFGHYVEDVYGRSDSPGGGHDGSPTDPRLAWSEGFSTYYSSAVRNNVFYMDSNSGGGFHDNIETGVTKAQQNGGMNQDVGEGMIAQILWDMGDSPTNDDDARKGGELHNDVLKVQPLYFKNIGTSGRGVAGVDLVDWFDGFFDTHGTSTCSAAEAIANQHTWPYDFAPCP